MLSLAEQLPTTSFDRHIQTLCASSKKHREKSLRHLFDAVVNRAEKLKKADGPSLVVTAHL